MRLGTVPEASEDPTLFLVSRGQYQSEDPTLFLVVEGGRGWGVGSEETVCVCVHVYVCIGVCMCV